MILAATMASSVDPVSQSAIPGYRLSALVCILVCLIRFRGRDEETTSSRNCCIADGNIGIGPINQSCGWLLRWRWDVCRKSLLLVWDYVRHPSVPGQNFEKSSARAGYTRLQGIRTLRTAEAAVKKLFLAGVAALSVLSASAAHAREWQGNMPKPVGKLPPYPPVVCVTPNWTPEPCEGRQPSHADAFEEV